MLRHSGLEEQLEQFLSITSLRFHLYRDAAYVVRSWMKTYFPTVGLTEQEFYNRQMCAERVAVEWNYKNMRQMWAVNDFARNLKVRRAPISLLYLYSALLLNFKTCLSR